MGKFAAAVAKQCRTIEAQIDDVFRTAVRKTVEDMIEPGPSLTRTGAGRLPVDTGYLRASFMLSEGTPKARQMPPREAGRTYDLDEGEHLAVIEKATVRRKLYATFSASHARLVEYGTSKMPPRPFVRTAVQRWPDNVKAAVAEVRQKGGRRG